MRGKDGKEHKRGEEKRRSPIKIFSKYDSKTRLVQKNFKIEVYCFKIIQVFKNHKIGLTVKNWQNPESIEQTTQITLSIGVLVSTKESIFLHYKVRGKQRQDM